MRYAEIKKYDVANGLGVRTSIFVTGCTHNCFNCFNKKLQSFDYGNLWTDKETKEVIEYLQLEHIAGLSLLGGEPMQNAKELLEIVREIKKHSKKDIWLWSGYRYEHILVDEDRLALLKEVDVLVDGRFVDHLKDLTLRFRGSSNQRIIDVKKSLVSKEMVLLDI